tara:strand:- start:86 stop:367 length:282 start_codon:yes stop_codon:yes gene_type:complete
LKKLIKLDDNQYSYLDKYINFFIKNYLVLIFVKRRAITFSAIIIFFYLFRAIDLFPFEMNLDFTKWGRNKIMRWIALSIIGILLEEYFIRRKS